MKKFFRMSMVLALAVSALVGCTKDYSEDLAKIDGRLTQIEDKMIPDVQSQIAAIKGNITAIESDLAKKATQEDLNKAKDEINAAIKALETKLAADITALQNGKADKTEVEALVKRITQAEADIAALNTYKARVENLEKKATELAAALEVVKENLAKKADKTYVDATFETKADAAAMYENIKNLIAAEEKARKEADAILDGKIVNLDEKLSAAIKKVSDDLVAEIARAKAAEKALADDIVKIFGRLDIVEADVDILQVKVADLREDLEAEIVARKATDKNLADLKAVVEAMYTNEQIDAMVKKLQDKIDENAEAIADLEEKKLDIAEWNKWLTEVYAVDKKALNDKIEAEIARAIAAEEALDGKIVAESERAKAAEKANKEYIEAVEKALNDFKAVYTAKVAEIDAEIEALAARVARLEAIAKRIQSISFVPEFVKGSTPVAESFMLTKDGAAADAKQTVRASFQVEPAAKTDDVVAAIKSGDAKIVYVTVGTKAAVKPIEATSIVEVKNENGLVYVTAVLPTKAENIAIALVYTEKEVEGEPYSNNEIVSDYAPVAVEKVKVESIYKLVKGDADYAAQDVAEEWVKAPARHTWYEGCEYRVKVDGAYVTIAEAAKFYGFTEAELTPKYSRTVTWPAAGLATTTHAIVNPTTAAFLTDYSEMKDQETARKDIGEIQKHTAVFKVFDVQVMTFANTYKIIKRQIDATLPDYTVTWNLKNLIKLSSAKTTAALFNKPIDKVFDENLKEQVLTFNNEYGEIDLQTIVNGGTAVTTVDGAAVSGFNFNVAVTAHIEAQLADVALTGYKNFFSTTGDSKKAIKNVYSISSKGDAIKDTDVNVKWNVTFTAKDKDATVTVDGIPPYVYDFGDITLNIPAAKTKDAMYAKVDKLAATKSEWWSEFAANVVYSHISRSKADVNATAVSTHTSVYAVPTNSYMKVYDESQIIIKEANITALSNVFAFETSYTTWFGVKYTWKTDYTGFAPLAVKLAYWPELVKEADATDYDGKLAGKTIVELAYDMSADGGYNIAVRETDLNRYFKVEGVSDLTAAQRAKLRVDFTRTGTNPAEDVHTLGHNPNPYYGANAFAPTGLISRDVVTNAGKIDNLPLNYMYYDGRDLGIAATLVIRKAVGEIVTGNRLEINLVLEDPLAISVAEDVVSVKRSDILDVTYDIDANVVINEAHRAAIDKTQNLVADEHANFITLPAPINKTADVFYNIQYSVELGEIRLGSKDGETLKEFPSDVLIYSDATHVLAYRHEAALLQKDVYVQVIYTMGHQFDWFVGEQDVHTASYWVRFHQ